MLVYKPAEKIFIETLQRYLSEILHEDIRIKAFECPISLPAFFRHMYGFYETWIAGIRCVIIAAAENCATPAQVAKHADLVRSSLDAIIIFATPSLSAYNRSRLIAQRVAFIVPSNQLYIPELATDLREHFHAMKETAASSLSPVAQAVLFHHILRIDDHAVTPSAIAKSLHYSAMSIGRAFDNLIACGLAYAEMYGKERHIYFDRNRRMLFDKARTLLRNPARAVKYIRSGHTKTPMKWGGESALSKLTDLSSPRMEVFAVAASHWKMIANENGFVEVKEQMADFAVETWSYDPAGLSEVSTVDPLSLYVQFRDHRDERLAIVADTLLERLSW